MSRLVPIVFAAFVALAALAAEPGPPGRGALDPSAIGERCRPESKSPMTPIPVCRFASPTR